MKMEELEMGKRFKYVNRNESISSDCLSLLYLDCQVVDAMCVESVYIACFLCYSLLHQPGTYKAVKDKEYH